MKIHIMVVLWCFMPLAIAPLLCVANLVALHLLMSVVLLAASPLLRSAGKCAVGTTCVTGSLMGEDQMAQQNAFLMIILMSSGSIGLGNELQFLRKY